MKRCILHFGRELYKLQERGGLKRGRGGLVSGSLLNTPYLLVYHVTGWAVPIGWLPGNYYGGACQGPAFECNGPVITRSLVGVSTLSCVGVL